MEKKVFKSGDIVTPEFLNSFQDEVKKNEETVSEHHGEFESLMKALMRVFTETFEEYSVSKDGFTATLDGKCLHISNGSCGVTLKPGDGYIEASVNGGGRVEISPFGIEFNGPGAHGLELSRNLIKIIGGLRSSNYPVEIKVIEGKLNINNDTEVEGELSAQELRINHNAEVEGKLSAQQLRIENDAEVEGELSAQELRIEKWRLCDYAQGSDGSFVIRHINNDTYEDFFVIRSDGLVTIKKAAHIINADIDEISLNSIKFSSCIVPETLTTNDYCDTLDDYNETYGNKNIIFRIPDSYSHSGGVIKMSTPFRLDADEENGKTIVIFNLGKIVLDVDYSYFGEEKSFTIPVGHAKRFIRIQHGKNKGWMPIS